MKTRIKLLKSVLTLVSVIMIGVVAITLPMAIQNAKSKAVAKAYNSYGVAASVSGKCYVGDKVIKMMSGESDEIVFNASDESSSPALDPAGDIVLSSTNKFVVFEYKFTNNSDTVSFLTRLTSTLDVENMKVSYLHSYQKLTDFSEISFDELDAIPVNLGTGTTLYIYVRVEIEKLTEKAMMSGIFSFDLYAEDVYEITLLSGTKTTTTYACYAMKLPRINLAEFKGLNFKGFFTEPNGQGEQIYDENGESNKIWDKQSGTTLYAYYV